MSRVELSNLLGSLRDKICSNTKLRQSPKTNIATNNQNTLDTDNASIKTEKSATAPLSFLQKCLGTQLKPNVKMSKFFNDHQENLSTSSISEDSSEHVPRPSLMQSKIIRLAKRSTINRNEKKDQDAINKPINDNCKIEAPSNEQCNVKKKKKRLFSACKEEMKYLSIPPTRKRCATARRWLENINKACTSPQGTRLRREKEYFYVSFKNCKTVLKSKCSTKPVKERCSKAIRKRIIKRIRHVPKLSLNHKTLKESYKEHIPSDLLSKTFC